jgi:hypothetical protein
MVLAKNLDCRLSWRWRALLKFRKPMSSRDHLKRPFLIVEDRARRFAVPGHLDRLTRSGNTASHGSCIWPRLGHATRRAHWMSLLRVQIFID